MNPEQKRGQLPPWPLKTVFVVCLAFANLCFVNAWQALESKYYDYFLQPPVNGLAALRYFAALLTDILLLALILWGLYAWIRRSSLPHSDSIVAIGFLGLLIVPLNLLRIEASLFTLGNPLILCALLVVAAVVLVWHRFLIRPVAILVMLSWLLLPIKIVSSAAHILTAAQYPQPVLADRLPGAAPRRLVWVIFDEFDERLAFDARPAGVHLPNLDAFQAESLSAAHAHRAARDTLIAIPSLLLGRVATHAEVLNAAELRLTIDGGTRQPYPSQDNIFALARSRGVNAAVSGWYHPYCRLFNNSLTDCVWAPADSCLESISTSLDPPIIQSFLQAAILFPKTLLARMPGMDRLGLHYKPIGYAPTPTRAAHQITEFQRIYDSALRYSVDPGLGFVYLHFPMPHHYGIYNTRSERLEPGGNYKDNLALTDKTLAGLRAAMETAHVWDSTVVLVSTDHSLRYTNDSPPGSGDNQPAFNPPGNEQPLIPFLLKFAGQHKALRYEPAFNALLTRDLILSILSAEVSTPEQAAEWLDRNRSRSPVSEGSPE